MADHFNFGKCSFKRSFQISDRLLTLLTSKGYSTASSAASIGPDVQQQNNRCGPPRRNAPL